MKIRSLAILGISLVTTLLHGPVYAASEGPTTSTMNQILAGGQNLQEGHRMAVITPVSVRRYKSLEGAVVDARPLTILGGTEIEVLEISRDGKVAHIGMDSSNASLSDIYVSVSDLRRATLLRVNDEVEEGDDDVEEIDETGDSDVVAIRKKKQSNGGMTYCYRDVKKTLLKAKKCNRYASGVRAVEGYKILARECGMKQVGAVSPASLPTYSVCVSSGGRPCGGGTHCGHIAIKLPNGKWFGAGTRGTPYLPNSKKKGYITRKIVGCLTPK